MWIPRFAASGLAILLLWLTGCGAQPSEWQSDSGTETPRVVQLPEVPSLAEQISQLKDGARDTLTLEATPTPAQLTQLKPLSAKIATIDVGLWKAVAALPLTNLERLKVRGPFSDADSKSLISAVPKLKFLNLPQADLTNDGVQQLTRLANLEQLRFASPRVTDEAFELLSKRQSLRFLHLLNVPITDKALPWIGKLKNLESFYLDGGKTTDDGLVKFTQSRRDVHFHKDQLHLDGTGHD